MPRPEPLQSVMLLASRYQQTRLIPPEHYPLVTEAFDQAKARLVPANGEVVIEVIGIIFKVLNQPLPNEEVLALWIHILSEYPEELLRAGARRMLKQSFGKPVPADLCRHMEQQLRDRKRDVMQIERLYALHNLHNLPLPAYPPEEANDRLSNGSSHLHRRIGHN